MVMKLMPIVNEAGEEMSMDEVKDFLKSQMAMSELLASDFRKFMAQSLADLEKQDKSHWPCGFRLFYVKDMELLDGQICDAVRVDFLVIPPIDHSGPLTEADIEYAAEYMHVYQCGLQLSAGEEQEVVGFIWTMKNSEIEKSAEETRKLLERFQQPKPKPNGG